MNYANVQDENALWLFFIELASEPWANVIVQIFNGHNWLFMVLYAKRKKRVQLKWNPENLKWKKSISEGPKNVTFVNCR